MCRKPLLGRLGGAGCPASEIRLHLQKGALARFQVARATIELLRVRRKSYLRVRNGRVVRFRRSTRVATDATDGVRELTLARLDGRDALGQLESKSSSSCSAAMRIARRRSCSVSIETGSFFCLPNKATHR